MPRDENRTNAGQSFPPGCHGSLRPNVCALLGHRPAHQQDEEHHERRRRRPRPRTRRSRRATRPAGRAVACRERSVICCDRAGSPVCCRKNSRPCPSQRWTAGFRGSSFSFSRRVWNCSRRSWMVWATEVPTLPPSLRSRASNPTAAPRSSRRDVQERGHVQRREDHRQARRSPPRAARPPATG